MGALLCNSLRTKVLLELVQRIDRLELTLLR
jgi:hypothetical protein